MLRILPLTGLGEIAPGADLAAILAAALRGAAPDGGDRDVLVVTQKIVSKAEGRFVALASVAVGDEAHRLAGITRKDPRLVQLVLDESSEIVRAAPNVLIARHRSGLVMANAGIDRSNLGPGRGDHVLLLPHDADAAAASLRAGLAGLVGGPPAVIVADSFGRPWRMGVTGVAIGASGLPALVDRRGTPDRDGRALEVTEIALADMIATAAGLAMGEGDEGVPAVLVRGLDWQAPPGRAADLVRPLAQDLFR